ncbi:MAG: DUF4185 domain-containing protein [Candidatus Anammoximicrobium sp.]|nr:DUF4185 domain-containing protein [Candidatus Anammoximicrobium sp.]
MNHAHDPFTPGRRFVLRVPVFALGLCMLFVSATRASDPGSYFGIRVVDDRTGRGVPLVELETVNHLRWMTDSGGWAAIDEPGLMGQTVFFFVRSHGYEFPKDGFGFDGVRLQLVAGQRATVKIKRLNVAERLYRVTGEGIYRDSVLLGESAPLAEPLGSGMVAGQDSTFAELYQGKIFWFWGDTSRMSYPLGHFWMAAATSQLPGQGGLDPGLGVNLRYFTDKDGFSRPVARLGVEKGMIWADGFVVLPDATGRERLACHYAHMESLSKMLGHGLAVFNDEKAEFERLKTLDLNDSRLFPGQGHPIRHRDGEVDYIYFGEVFPTVRVQADWEHYVDPAAYEAFTCLDEKAAPSEPVLRRDSEGRVRYDWRRNARPIDAATEQKLIAAGRLPAEQARFLPADADTGKPVLMHRGTVRYNAHRQRWIMIAGQLGGTSMLGEIWYAEAAEPTGPWRHAQKIVTHDRYSFYNPAHHPFFDQDGGRRIYFEGTYTQTFSGNPVATPRYDYNQVMYRLDLAEPRLEAVRK